MVNEEQGIMRDEWKDAVYESQILGTPTPENPKIPTELTSRIQDAMDRRRDRFYLEMKKAVDEWLEENKSGKFGFHSERNIVSSIEQWGEE